MQVLFRKQALIVQVNDVQQRLPAHGLQSFFNHMALFGPQVCWKRCTASGHGMQIPCEQSLHRTPDLHKQIAGVQWGLYQHQHGFHHAPTMLEDFGRHRRVLPTQMLGSSPGRGY